VIFPSSAILRTYEAAYKIDYAFGVDILHYLPLLWAITAGRRKNIFDKPMYFLCSIKINIKLKTDDDRNSQNKFSRYEYVRMHRFCCFHANF